jgi:hypothetical protein
MAPHAGQAFAGPEVGPPRPREEPRDPDNQSRTRGRNGLEQWGRPGLHLPVDQDLALVVQDADVHGTGMQGKAAVQWVRCGVEAPEGSSSRSSFPEYQHTIGVC